MFDAMTQASTYDMKNPCFMTNCQGQIECPGIYQTDVLLSKAQAWIDTSVKAGKPFFAYINPTAPHNDNSGKGWAPPPPPTRHEHLYPGVSIACAVLTNRRE
jgi:hypothetical protein